MASIFDSAPFMAIRGGFKGFEDGFRGKIDTNEKFGDGYRENDPEKKSAAGQFLSDYSGIQGGAAVGQKTSAWIGGLVCAGLMAGVAFPMAIAMAGVFPFFAAGLLTLAAGMIGGPLMGVVGKYVGGFLGAGVGAIGGSAVGAYNGVFKKGNYAEKAEEKELAPKPVPDSPQPGVNAPLTARQQATPIDGPVVIPRYPPKVEQIIENSLPPESEKDAALAANARVRTSFASRIGQAFSAFGNKVLGVMGLSPAVDTRSYAGASHQAPSAPRYYTPAATNQAAAFRQADAAMQGVRLPLAAVTPPAPAQGGFVDKLNAERGRAVQTTASR